jgi:uncharacterized membrane-anchored protein YitT (DUF2179 family)
VLAFGCAVFVVPFDLVTGGVTGISIIVDNIIGGAIDIDIIIAAITWGLFFLGLCFLGWDFALKTLTSTVIYPVAISLFLKLVSPDVLGGILYLNTEYDIALIISALFGGICVGTGCALTFMGGGSTGGVDIIAFILCKYFKKWKSSTVIFIVDATAVVLGLFVIQDLIRTLLGVISAWLCAMVIERIFIGSGQAFTAQIVSDKYEEINLAIRNEINRTTTMYMAVGGYSGQPKTALSVTFTMRQYAELMSVIKRIDPTAFVSITRAHEINGEGFTYGSHD